METKEQKYSLSYYCVICGKQHALGEGDWADRGPWSLGTITEELTTYGKLLPLTRAARWWVYDIARCDVETLKACADFFRCPFGGTRLADSGDGIYEAASKLWVRMERYHSGRAIKAAITRASKLPVLSAEELIQDLIDYTGAVVEEVPAFKKSGGTP